MYAIRFAFFLFLIIVALPLFGSPGDERSWKVLVTIPPHKYFVEKIAEDTVTVQVLVSPGVTAHTFEPSPKQVITASEADVWFRLGETFEGIALAAFKSHNTRVKDVDLRQGVDLITTEHGCAYHPHEGADLHYWLSPRQAKIQAKTIAEALTRQYPENGQKYAQNLENLLEELDTLDREIATALNPLAQRTIMVSHPAYAYFCRDYNLSQLSVEFEGKDPKPRQLTQILEKARELGIQTIFIQPQFSNKGAKLVAEQLGASTVTLDPYGDNYPEMMRDIATKIAHKK